MLIIYISCSFYILSWERNNFDTNSAPAAKVCPHR